jgi:hypothetical protein
MGKVLMIMALGQVQISQDTLGTRVQAAIHKVLYILASGQEVVCRLCLVGRVQATMDSIIVKMFDRAQIFRMGIAKVINQQMLTSMVKKFNKM